MISLMLAPKDLANASRKSGYDHVNSANGGQNGHGNSGQFWRAASGAKKVPGDTWRGPSRSTPLEAAQDYCDYINSGQVATPARLKTAGHQYTVDRTLDEEVQAALGVLRDAEGQREGKQGYVYCIREAIPGGGFSHVKIGYSTNPWKRVAELQTGNPRPLALVSMKEGTLEDERAIHAKYIRLNILQEWFTTTKEMLLEFDLDQDGNPYETKKGA